MTTTAVPIPYRMVKKDHHYTNTRRDEYTSYSNISEQHAIEQLIVHIAADRGKIVEPILVGVDLTGVYTHVMIAHADPHKEPIDLSLIFKVVAFVAFIVFIGGILALCLLP